MMPSATLHCVPLLGLDWVCFGFALLCFVLLRFALLCFALCCVALFCSAVLSISGVWVTIDIGMFFTGTVGRDVANWQFCHSHAFDFTPLCIFYIMDLSDCFSLAFSMFRSVHSNLFFIVATVTIILDMRWKLDYSMILSLHDMDYVILRHQITSWENVF